VMFDSEWPLARRCTAPQRRGIHLWHAWAHTAKVVQLGDGLSLVV
jgi:hypothetical protein